MNPPAPPRSGVRYVVILVTTLMSVLLYLDRFCISFAEGYIQEDLGLTDVQVGWMLSAFFGSYALFQVPSGWLTDRFGSRLMLSLYVLLWSVFTGLTGVAFGFVMLLGLRLGFGLAQAGAYPTGASVISKWVPFSARGTASGIVAAGGRAGGWMAMILTGYLIVWLTPLSTPATLTEGDLLNPAKLAHQIQQNPEANVTASAADRRLVERLDPETRSVITRLANDHTKAAAEHATRLKTDDQLPAVPAAVITTIEDRQQLAAGLNAVIALRDAFSAEAIQPLSVEKEASRLARSDREGLTELQVLRLNRLVIEAAHPKSIRRLYGRGWRPMMLVYGGIGIVVAWLVWTWTRNLPREHPRCNAAELELIEGDARMVAARATGKVRGVPIRRLVTSRSISLLCLAQFTTNIGWVFVMTWAPRYFESVHKVPTEMRGFMLSIPPLVGFFGMLAGGVLTDRLVGIVGLRWGRVLPMSLSRFMAMAAYIACLFQPSPWLAVAMFSLVAFSTDLGIGAVWAYNQDVGGRHVGSVLGWGNMWGNLGAAITPPFLIWVVGDTQNWTVAFLVCAGAFLISGLASLGVDATKPVVTD